MGSERLVGSENDRRSLYRSPMRVHQSGGFARASHTEQRLMHQAVVDAVDNLRDRGRLITGKIEVSLNRSAKS